MKKIKLNFKIPEIIILSIIVFALIISLICFFLQDRGHKRVFIFESMDKAGLFIETRYLIPFESNQSIETDILQYTEDLLLGPKTHRFKPLFSSKTVVDSLFLRDDTLYVNISKEALHPEKTTSTIEVGVDLFKKNILRNFPQVKQVDFFINSIHAYEQIQ